MAEISKLSPIVAKWEGGFVNDPKDKGGATNMGITINTWRAIGYDKDGDGDIDIQDIRKLDYNDFNAVLKQYWNRWQANGIINQSIANLLVDWVWCSGKWGIVFPQRILKLADDGVVGKKTLESVNQRIKENPQQFFDELMKSRVKFIHGIVNKSVAEYEKSIKRKATEEELLKHTQKKFLKGWLNRLNDFKYTG